MDNIDYILLIIAYFLGSIPFGLVVTKLAGKGDIRKEGSGNIGATNVARIAGKKLGAIALILDVLKGIIAVIIAKYLTDSAIIINLVAAFAVIGHIFPIWLKFKGGKGVATGFAVITIVCYPLGIFSLSIWIAIFVFSGISSLSAIISMLLTPIAAFFMVEKLGIEVVYLSLFISILVIIRHYSNIKRLLKGEEKSAKGVKNDK